MSEELKRRCVKRAHRLLRMEPESFIETLPYLPNTLTATTLIVLLMGDWKYRFALPAHDGPYWKLNGQLPAFAAALLGRTKGWPVSAAARSLELVKVEKQTHYLTPSYEVDRLAWALRGMPTPAMDIAYKRMASCL